MCGSHLGTTFVICQHCHHHFQCCEAVIQLHQQFSGHNPPTCTAELIETLFILFLDSCAWPSRMWLVFHITVVTAPPHCFTALMFTVWSPNIQQVLMNVGAIYFLHGGIQWHTFASSTLPCQMPFCQTAPLLPSVIWQQHAMGYWWEGSSPIVLPLTYVT